MPSTRACEAAASWRAGPSTWPPRGAGEGGGGLVPLSLVGCGGDEEEKKPAATTGPAAVLDSTKGKPGGKLVWSSFGDWGGSLDMIGFGDYSLRQLSGLTPDGLLETRSGTPAFPGTDKGMQPGLATALPEISPDKLSYTLKLKDAKFHDGTPVTSEDVKWSLGAPGARQEPSPGGALLVRGRE